MLMKFAARISRKRLTTKASPLLGIHNSLELAILFPNSSASEFTRDNNHTYNPPPSPPFPHQGHGLGLSRHLTTINFLINNQHCHDDHLWTLDNSHQLIASPSPLLGKIFLLRAKFCLHLSSREADEGPSKRLLE